MTDGIDDLLRISLERCDNGQCVFCGVILKNNASNVIKCKSKDCEKLYRLIGKNTVSYFNGYKSRYNKKHHTKFGPIIIIDYNYLYYSFNNDGSLDDHSDSYTNDELEMLKCYFESVEYDDEDKRDGQIELSNTFLSPIDAAKALHLAFDKFKDESIRKKLPVQVKQKRKKGPAFVYLIKIENYNLYKIGVASNIKNRINSIQTSNPFNVQLVHKKLVNDPFNVERKLHFRYKNQNINREWFNLKLCDVYKIKMFLND